MPTTDCYRMLDLGDHDHQKQPSIAQCSMPLNAKFSPQLDTKSRFVSNFKLSKNVSLNKMNHYLIYLNGNSILCMNLRHRTLGW